MGKPGSKPAGKPMGKPGSKPAGKPIGKSTGKPTGKPGLKPALKPKSVNPFGEKKRPAGGRKFGGKGPRDFKRRRPEEVLDIQLTDKELGEVTVIKRKLAEIREYKLILAEDGLKPDQQDKERESQLIVRLLRIEKNAKMAARQRAKAAKTEAFREEAEKAEFAKQKKKSRQDRFSDDEDGDDDYRSREDDDHDDDGDDY
jgi:hypothetical protein